MSSQSERDRLAQANYATQHSSNSQTLQTASGVKRQKFLTQTVLKHPVGDPSGSIQNMSGSFADDCQSQGGLVMVSVDTEKRQTMGPAFQVVTDEDDDDMNQQEQPNFGQYDNDQINNPPLDTNTQQQQLNSVRLSQSNQRQNPGDTNNDNTSIGAAASEIQAEWEHIEVPSTVLQPPGQRSNRPSTNTHNIVELGDVVDTESDQVLLGSCYDDTRTVQMAMNLSPRVQVERAGRRATVTSNGSQMSHLGENLQQIEQAHQLHELTVVDEDDDVAKTQRVNEAWRRQKLLDHMQEDEEEEDISKTQRDGERSPDKNRLMSARQEYAEDDSAEDYPIHSTTREGKSSQMLQDVGEVDQPPTLAQMAKENTMSFGINASAMNGFQKASQSANHHNNPAPDTKAQSPSEPSDSFYINTGRSNFTAKQSSQASMVNIVTPRDYNFSKIQVKNLNDNQVSQVNQNEQETQFTRESFEPRHNERLTIHQAEDTAEEDYQATVISSKKNVSTYETESKHQNQQKKVVVKPLNLFIDNHLQKSPDQLKQSTDHVPPMQLSDTPQACQEISQHSILYPQPKHQQDQEQQLSAQQVYLNHQQQKFQQSQMQLQQQEQQRNNNNQIKQSQHHQIKSPSQFDDGLGLEKQQFIVEKEPVYPGTEPKPKLFQNRPQQHLLHQHQYSDHNQNQNLEQQQQQPPLMSFPVVRRQQHQNNQQPPSSYQASQGGGLAGQSSLAPAEQFLTLDHFLNEQQLSSQSPQPNALTMYTATDRLSAARQASGDLSSQTTLLARNNFSQVDSDGSSLRKTDTTVHQQHHRESRQGQFNNMMQVQQVQQMQRGDVRQHGDTRVQQTTAVQMQQYAQHTQLPQQHHTQQNPDKANRMASTSPLRVDPDEIKRRQLTRQQTLEQKRKQEIEEIRRQARQRELVRERKIMAVVFVQKWVRGHLCRLEYARMRANFRYIRKLRRMLSIAYGRKKSRFIKQLVFALSETGKKHQKQFEAEIGAFCATLIQKVWRGYFFRKVIKQSLVRQQKSKRSLRALIQGYRTRCILYRTRDCVNIQRDVQEVLQQLRHWQHKLKTLHPATTTKQEHIMIKTSIKQLKEERSVKVSTLIRTVNHLKNRGRWIHQLLPQKQSVQAQFRRRQEEDTSQRFQQNSHSAAVTPSQQQSMQLDGDFVFNDGQPLLHEQVSHQKFFGDEIENENSFVLPGATVLHDETARNLLSDVVGDLSPLAGARPAQPLQRPGWGQPSRDTDQGVMAMMGKNHNQNQNNETEDDLAMLWPSSNKQNNQPENAENNDDDNDVLAMMWPSQKKQQTQVQRTTNNGQRKSGARSSMEILQKKLAEPAYDDDEQSDMLDADDSNATVGIKWPTATAMLTDVKASGDLNSSDKRQADKQRWLDQQEEEMPPKSSALQQSIVIQSKWADHNQQNPPASHWDEQPVGGGGNQGWDEQPVGGAKPQQQQSNVSRDPYQDNIDEQPLVSARVNHNLNPVSANLSHRSNQDESQMSIAPPKIGLSEFELMIEKAMQEAGEQPPSSSQKAPGVKKVPVNKKSQPQSSAQATGDEENPAKKKKTEAAAALLAKRTRYDPRQALKKGKKGPTASLKKKDDQAQDGGKQVQENDDIVLVKAQVIIKNEIPDNKSDDEPSKAPSSQTKQALNTKKPQHAFKNKKKDPQPKDEVPESAPEQIPVADSEQANKAKPKPFLKRKTKTMQPAKINWKPKSRIDCWNGASKTQQQQQQTTKRDFVNPTQQAVSKTMIEAQQELEQSLPKFSDNQPNSRYPQAADDQQSVKTTQKVPLTLDNIDTDYDCETVPNEQLYEEFEERKALPHSDQMINANWKSQFQENNHHNGIKDGINYPGVNNLQSIQQQKPPQQQRIKKLPQSQISNMRKPRTQEEEDFDQEPTPRQMVQQTTQQRFHRGHPHMPNSRQPLMTPPDKGVPEIIAQNNYNTFSQPDFIPQQPNHAQPPQQIQLGQSLMVDPRQADPFGSSTHHHDNGLNISASEIQAQLSSVMTHADVAFPLGRDGSPQMLESGQNLQLEELQKVFDLFHMHTETIEEAIPLTSLQRLQQRGANGLSARGGGALQQSTRTVTKRSLKNHTFAEIQIKDVMGQDTCIPHLDINYSVFFQSYSTDQFEEVYEDLKGHYKRLCDEEPDSSVIDDDSQNMSQF